MRLKKRPVVKKRGFTILELLVVIVVMGILTTVAVTRYLVAQDRAHVTAAVADADHFRKALAVYAVDYATFPTEERANVEALAHDLIDPEGDDYMILPHGETFRSFRYEPVEEGKSYAIEIVANDNGGTTIVATPDGTVVL